VKIRKSQTMKNLIIVLISVITLASCSKKVSELPAPSATGSNTFGASVNGSLWAPKGFGIMPTAPILEANFAGNNSYRINARNFASSPTSTEFEILLKNVTGPGTYPLNQTTAIYPNENASYAMYTLQKFQLVSQWVTSSTNGGQVVITKVDPDNKIIAGTFQFTAADTYGTASPVNVTDGRFDIKIQ
jgi:hypothetical protein